MTICACLRHERSGVCQARRCNCDCHSENEKLEKLYDHLRTAPSEDAAFSILMDIRKLENKHE